MKKLLATAAVILSANTAMAETVTLTMEQIQKIENHIVSLNTQITDLTEQVSTQKNTIQELMAQLEEAQSVKPSENADSILEGLIGTTSVEVNNTEQENVNEIDGSDEISCEQYGNLAYKIMQGRQEGIAMSELMKAAHGNDIMKAMVVLAYESPRYSTAKNQQKEAQDFRITNEKMCYKSGKK